MLLLRATALDLYANRVIIFKYCLKQPFVATVARGKASHCIKYNVVQLQFQLKDLTFVCIAHFQATVGF